MSAALHHTVGSRGGSPIYGVAGGTPALPPREGSPTPFLIPSCLASITSLLLTSVSFIFIPFFYLTLVLLPREKCFEK